MGNDRPIITYYWQTQFGDEEWAASFRSMSDQFSICRYAAGVQGQRVGNGGSQNLVVLVDGHISANKAIRQCWRWSASYFVWCATRMSNADKRAGLLCTRLKIFLGFWVVMGEGEHQMVLRTLVSLPACEALETLENGQCRVEGRMQIWEIYLGFNKSECDLG